VTLVHLVGFIKKKFFMMHGHTNVKLLEAFLNMPVTCACATDEAFFLVNSKPSSHWATLLKARLSAVLNYQTLD
jgi:hypothetical protein